MCEGGGTANATLVELRLSSDRRRRRAPRPVHRRPRGIPRVGARLRREGGRARTTRSGRRAAGCRARSSSRWARSACSAWPSRRSTAAAGMPDYRYNVVLQEEAARALVTLSTVRTQLEVILPYFLHYANEEQRKRWFPGLAAGTLLTAVAMTEPGTGSDLAGMRTTAVRDGDDYIVNGAKTFITGGMQADLVVVVARTSTDPDNRRKGLTLFVVEDGMPGLHPRPRAGEDGLQGAGHRRAVVRRRARAGRQRAGRGRRGIRLSRPQPAAGAADRRGRFGGAGPLGDRRSDRLHQGPQGIRHAGRVVPEHQVRARRLLDRGRGRPGDARPRGRRCTSTASSPAPTRPG